MWHRADDPHGPPTKWLRRNRLSAVQTEGTLLHDAASHVGRLADQAKVSAGRQSHAFKRSPYDRLLGHQFRDRGAGVVVFAVR
jgi:hypothetical protein